MNKFLALFSFKQFIECRPISTRITADGKEVPKSRNVENRITLIGTDNTVSITDLKNAQNLSERRELKLVKLQDVDSKTRRPVYKLMTNKEYHAEEIQRRSEKQSARQNSPIKGAKLLTLSTKIGEHDLMTGVKKMIKLLDKQYEVRVTVTGEGESVTDKSEHIYSVIEKNVKASGKIVQKREKGNTLRFQLLPLRNSTAQAGKTSSDGGENSNVTNSTAQAGKTSSDGGENSNVTNSTAQAGKTSSDGGENSNVTNSTAQAGKTSSDGGVKSNGPL